MLLLKQFINNKWVLTDLDATLPLERDTTQVDVVIDFDGAVCWSADNMTSEQLVNSLLLQVTDCLSELLTLCMRSVAALVLLW